MMPRLLESFQNDTSVVPNYPASLVTHLLPAVPFTAWHLLIPERLVLFNGCLCFSRALCLTPSST